MIGSVGWWWARGYGVRLFSHAINLYWFIEVHWISAMGETFSVSSHARMVHFISGYWLDSSCSGVHPYNMSIISKNQINYATISGSFENILWWEVQTSFYRT